MRRVLTTISAVATSFFIFSSPVIAQSTNPDILDYTRNTLQIITLISTAAAVFFLVQAGYLYITSAGRPDALESAKKTIRNAIIGLVIVFAANIITTVFQHAMNSPTSPSAGAQLEMVAIETVEPSEGLTQVLIDAIASFIQNIELVYVENMTQNGQEPSTEIAQKMIEADVALLATHFSLSHTRARDAATKQGTRVASMPGITFDMLDRTSTADYDTINTQSTILAEKLTKAHSFKITSKEGTNLSGSLKARTGLADGGILHNSGDMGNLPAGEAFIAPVEDSVNGTLVIDASLADVTLDSPITLTIKNGKITEISGKVAAKEFEKQLNKVGESARVIAELGIGTNPTVDAFGDVLEAEKALGTCHIAFGDNVSMGGTNNAPFHSDGVVLMPTLVLINEETNTEEKIIESGRLLEL
jgi:leucyl aminopeptidase (aminopeptidase T)